MAATALGERGMQDWFRGKGREDKMGSFGIPVRLSDAKHTKSPYSFGGISFFKAYSSSMLLHECPHCWAPSSIEPNNSPCLLSSLLGTGRGKISIQISLIPFPSFFLCYI